MERASRPSGPKCFTPGPGAYNIPTYGQCSGKSPVMGTRLQPLRSMKTPGAGSYELAQRFNGCARVTLSKGFSFRKRTEIPGGKFKPPGPGMYKMTPQDKGPSAPVAQRYKPPRGLVTPGVGSYEVAEDIAGDFLHMGSCVGRKGPRSKTPGPGAYNQKSEDRQYTYMGLRIEHGSALGVTSKTPGVGSYEIAADICD